MFDRMYRLLELYAPDELGGGGQPSGGGSVATPPAAASAPADSAVPSPSTPVPSPSPPAGTPTSPAGSVASQTPVQGAAGQGQAGGGTGFTSPREYLNSLGHSDLANQFQDDATLIATLAQQARQYQQHQQLLPYAQQYANHAAEFQAWMKTKQAAEEAERSKKKNYFGLPEWDPQWMQMVENDPATGQPVLKPGAPPDLLNRIHTYSNALRQFQDKLWSNPQEALGPLIREMAQEEAKKLVGESLGGYQEKQQIDGFIRQNSSWLHARDQSGQLVMNPANGQPVLSPVGRVFQQHVYNLHQQGITDVARQTEIAMRLTKADVYEAQLAQQQPAPAGQPAVNLQQQANQAYLAQYNGTAGTNRLPAPAAAVAPSLQAGATVQPNAGLSLRDRMMKRFADEKITDADIAASMQRSQSAA